jgi:RNA recognition motif-containing protein
MATPLSINSATLFLGDLSIFCQEKELFELFQKYGPIESIEIKRSEKNKPCLAYGFIKFAHRQSAADAIEQVNETLFMGRFIRVAWALDDPSSKTPWMKFFENKKVKTTAQVHVIFNSRNIGAPVNESTLREVFSNFGEIIDVTINKTAFNQDYGFQSGYGFIHFPLTEAGVASALNAISQLNKTVVDHVAYECTVSHGLKNFLSTGNSSRTSQIPPANSPHMAQSRSPRGFNVAGQQPRPPAHSNYRGAMTVAFPPSVPSPHHSHGGASHSFFPGQQLPYPPQQSIQSTGYSQFPAQSISPFPQQAPANYSPRVFDFPEAHDASSSMFSMPLQDSRGRQFGQYEGGAMGRGYPSLSSVPSQSSLFSAYSPRESSNASFHSSSSSSVGLGSGLGSGFGGSFGNSDFLDERRSSSMSAPPSAGAAESVPNALEQQHP